MTQLKQSSEQNHAENEKSNQCTVQNYRIHLKLLLDSDLTSVHDNDKISSHLQSYSMTLVSSTTLLITEINQS